MHEDCERVSHATPQTAIYANITQTCRIRVYCSWFWVVLVGFVGFTGGFGWCWLVLLVVLAGFGWFWVVLAGFGWFFLVPCFSNQSHSIFIKAIDDAFYGFTGVINHLGC